MSHILICNIAIVTRIVGSEERVAAALVHKIQGTKAFCTLNLGLEGACDTFFAADKSLAKGDNCGSRGFVDFCLSNFTA